MSDGDGDDDGQELQEPVETTAAADTVTTPTIGPDSDLMTGQEQPSDQILGTTADPDASKRKKKPQKVVLRVLGTATLIREIAKEMGWGVGGKGCKWDVCWTPTNHLLRSTKLRINGLQKLNHFPAMSDLARKDFLANNLNQMRNALPRIYNFFPTTYNLPRQWAQLRRVLDRRRQITPSTTDGPTAGKRGRRLPLTYIIKPQAASQGRGISVVQSLDHLTSTDTCIVQRYVSKPLLIDGFKFDLRLYVLVASVDPLVVYVYDDGLARLATKKYKRPRKANLRHSTMHLTNYAVNKASKDFVRDEDEGRGSKRSLSSVMHTMQEQGVDTRLLWRRMVDVILRTLLCVQPALSEAYRCYFGATQRRPTGRAALTQLGLERAKLSSCFEILGFDVLVDKTLRPWLLEVNHAPSFASGSALDRRIKSGVLRGAFHMLCPTMLQKRNFVSGTERDWRRRLWGNGPPATPPYNKTPEGQDKASHTRNNSRSNSPLKAPGSSSNETAEGRSRRRSSAASAEGGHSRRQSGQAGRGSFLNADNVRSRKATPDRQRSTPPSHTPLRRRLSSSDVSQPHTNTSPTKGPSRPANKKTATAHHRHVSSPHLPIASSTRDLLRLREMSGVGTPRDDIECESGWDEDGTGEDEDTGMVDVDVRGGLSALMRHKAATRLPLGPAGCLRRQRLESVPKETSFRMRQQRLLEQQASPTPEAPLASAPPVPPPPPPEPNIDDEEDGERRLTEALNKMKAALQSLPEHVWQTADNDEEEDESDDEELKAESDEEWAEEDCLKVHAEPLATKGASPPQEQPSDQGMEYGAPKKDESNLNDLLARDGEGMTGEETEEEGGDTEGRNGEDQEGWGDWAKGEYEVPVDVPDYCHGTGTVTSSLRRGYSLIYPPQDPGLCSLYSHILQVAHATISRPWVRMMDGGDKKGNT